MTYPHRAIEHTTDEGRRCAICGTTVVGYGQLVRHEGEPNRTIEPAKPDAAAFGRALLLVSNALLERQVDDPVGAARAAVERLYVAGLIRRTAAPPQHVTHL